MDIAWAIILQLNSFSKIGKIHSVLNLLPHHHQKQVEFFKFLIIAQLSNIDTNNRKINRVYELSKEIFFSKAK